LNKVRLVRDPAAYYFIGNEGKTTSADRTDYKTVCTAMSTLGFSSQEAQTIWSIVAGVLHLVYDSIE
jgi:myosin heavy subunit